jgi:endothelin-converting enzyme
VKNKQVIQSILDPNTAPASHMRSLATSQVSESPAEDEYDEMLLGKLRGLYRSCMDEDYLDEVGAAPLLKVTDTIRKLFNGSTTIVDASVDENKEKDLNLTAAIVYLHSRGTHRLVLNS